jgi:hypothetical protein
MKTEEYSQYLKQLQYVVYDQLLPQVVMIRTIAKQARDFDVTTIEVEPLLHHIFTGLTHEIVLLLARLFDKKNSDYNIYHFIEYARTNLAVIEWKDPVAISNESLKEQLHLIAAHETTIEMLRKQRNKYYAHYDKKYFFSPEALETDYPFSVDDAVSLMVLLQTVIAKHSLALWLSCRICMDHACEMAAYRLFSTLLGAYNESRQINRPNPTPLVAAHGEKRIRSEKQHGGIQGVESERGSPHRRDSDEGVRR